VEAFRTDADHDVAKDENADQTGTGAENVEMSVDDACNTLHSQAAAARNTNAVENIPVGEDLAESMGSASLRVHTQPHIRLRLVGKQPLPRDTGLVSSEFEASPLPLLMETPPFSRSQTAVTRAAIGHTLAPAEQGLMVWVQGDGWGGGSGTYLATVTEADEQTFTIIRRGGCWVEAHVLRELCRLCPRGESDSISAGSDDTDNDGRQSVKRRRITSRTG
jgi:hypothetical protein